MRRKKPPTRQTAKPVAQVSKPAVSPISKSAARGNGERTGFVEHSQVWKPAIQQTWKSALPAAIVIGASAGAIDALTAILPSLPRDYSLPILVVVHLPTDKKSIIAELFAARCQIAVKEAEDKENIRPGTAYFAPPNYHLLVEPDFRLSLSSDEPVLYSRPAIDVLFESAADAYGNSLIGIILTGASSDGANGLRAVCASGGIALVQDPKTAEASAMPQAALKACPQARVLCLNDISATLKTQTFNR